MMQASSSATDNNNTAAETTTTNNTGIVRLQQILNGIAKQLVAQDAPGLKASALALKEEEASSSKPQQVMNVLAPFLFQKEAEDDKCDGLSASNALSVLAFLVASDEESYLKPASRAVKKTAVAAVPIVNNNSINNNNFAVSQQLLLTMVAQLSGYDIETSANATDTIVACSRKLGRTFIEPALQAIVASWKAAIMDSNNNRHVASTASVRCATTVTEMVSVLDDTTMTCAMESGAMDLFLTMLKDNSDPLVQMSMLDLVEKMATTRPVHYQRATWLLTTTCGGGGGVVEPILKLAGGMQDDDEPDAILGGAALRIVAALCKLAHIRHEQDGTGQGDFRELMTTTTGGGSGGGGGLNLVACFHRALHKFAVSGSGEMDRLALVDAISSFAAASSSALDLVLNDDVTKQAWLSLAVAQPHLKTAIVMSVAMVLDPPIVVDANGDSIMTPQQQQLHRLDRASAMKLYSSLGQTNHDQDPTSLLLSMTRSTLAETRLGAYAMFQAMARLPDGAGAQVLFSHASFLDFILTRDHDRETTKQGREGKFAIVQAIAQSQVMGLLAPEIVARIENHLKQGPHYYQARSWELATDQ